MYEQKLMRGNKEKMLKTGQFVFGDETYKKSEKSP